MASAIKDNTALQTVTLEHNYVPTGFSSAMDGSVGGEAEVPESLRSEIRAALQGGDSGEQAAS